MIDRSKMCSAKAVIELVEYMMPYVAFKKEPHLVLEAYSNCREQGYSLSDLDKKISVSEYRNSDSIVVYYGNYNDFRNGNIPSSKVYKRKKIFDWNKHLEAAEFILDFFKGK